MVETKGGGGGGVRRGKGRVHPEDFGIKKQNGRGTLNCRPGKKCIGNRKERGQMGTTHHSRERGERRDWERRVNDPLGLRRRTRLKVFLKKRSYLRANKSRRL